MDRERVEKPQETPVPDLMDRLINVLMRGHSLPNRSSLDVKLFCTTTITTIRGLMC